MGCHPLARHPRASVIRQLFRDGADVWHAAADMARISIQEYSERWAPYPYPQISVVQGPIMGGMEYPMLSFNGIEAYNAYFILTHEVGHNWFPMLVGSNERMHAWMDEGAEHLHQHLQHGALAAAGVG